MSASLSDDGLPRAIEDVQPINERDLPRLPQTGRQLGPSDALLWPLDSSRGLLAANAARRLAKRIVDVVGSTLALLLLAPLLLAAVAAIKITSPGPALYISKRVGFEGRQFRLFKFRSMYANAEVERAALVALDETTGPVFKIRNDPRITPVGRLLRKGSIDELPQLWNVLKGDMSLVGPRPPIPAEVETYTPLEMQRLAVKPGITCIWQVSGRSDVDFAEWVRMDLDYIQHWTLTLDLLLLVKTVPAVLSARGAY